MKTTSHKRKIRLASLLLALVMLFATGCGSSKDESDEGDAVRVQDPTAFLGIEPYSEEAVGEKGGMQKVFWLKEECASLGKEYVDALLQVNELMLLSLREHESRTGDISDLYFLGYIGDREVHELTPVIENMPQCHVFVRVTYVEDISAVRLQVLHAGGFAFTDMGERGDTAQYGSIALPLYEDSGEEEQDAPAPQPEPQPAPQPVTPTVPDGPAFPDLSVFFHREPSGDTPDSGGRYIAFRGVPDTYADTLLNELYALLADSRYHLEPAGYEEAALTENVYRTDYLFDYTGSEKIEEVTYERIGELYALRVMFVHYEKEHIMSIAFHFSDEFVLEDPGVVTSIKDTGTPDSGADIVLDNLGDLANGGSSGGSSGGSGGGDYVAPGYDPYIPDASKLPCLTCHGDGDCNSCGGYGYKFKNDIRSDCTRCTGGNCPSCGGSGTR